MPLIERLKLDHRVLAMFLRPLWPESDPHSIRDWRPFSEDLQRYLHEQAAGPFVGVGHSIGAVVTLRAALREPALFRALILIDPVLLPPSRILQLRVARALGLANRLNSRIETTLKRRRKFDDLEQLFAGYRRREVFRFFSDEHLRVLIQGITRRAPGGGYELAYSPEWEARIYQTAIWNDADIWNGLPRLQVPALLIRGSQTDTFWSHTARLVEKRNPAMKTVTIPDSTHLVALERPEEVAAVAHEFLVQAALAK
jgi:pimeloyl-ACP methyl ester carboxylesterase